MPHPSPRSSIVTTVNTAGKTVWGTTPRLTVEADISQVSGSNGRSEA